MIEVNELMRLLPAEVARQTVLGTRLGDDLDRHIYSSGRRVRFPDTELGRVVETWVQDGIWVLDGEPVRPAPISQAQRMGMAAFARRSMRVECVALIQTLIQERARTRAAWRNSPPGMPADPVSLDPKQNEVLAERVRRMHALRFTAYQVHQFGDDELSFPVRNPDERSGVHHDVLNTDATQIVGGSWVRLPSNWYSSIVKTGLYGFDKELTLHVVYKGWYESTLCHIYECVWAHRTSGSRHYGRVERVHGVLAEHCPGGRADRSRRSFARSDESIDAAAKLARRRFSGWERKQLADVHERAQTGKPIAWDRYPAIAAPESATAPADLSNVVQSVPLEQGGRPHVPGLAYNPDRYLGAPSHRMHLDMREAGQWGVVFTGRYVPLEDLLRKHRATVSMAAKTLADDKASRRGRHRDAARAAARRGQGA